ncbi:MAG TPA: hypothetical protein PLX66_02550 [Bacilli bacterium]|nr:hypothetical protein [Bacilli bacterium]
MKNTNDTEQIIKFLKILGIVIIFLVAIYFLTLKVADKEEENNDTEVTRNEVVVGTSLSLSDDEYYVLFYDPESNIASYLDSWQDSYLEADSTPKLYYVDLSLAINKKFVTEEDSNSKATKETDLKIKDGTLIIVKNAKITNYIENLQEIYQLLN